MVVSKDKLSRRKSIAAPTQSVIVKPTDTRRKRRAHSIAPGKIISPLSRSRLSLGPVKGILKGAKRRSTESQNPDDLNATQSMDLTQENSSSQPSRQSLLARRVSFSSTAHVRLFGRNHTSSTIEGDSPAPSSDDPVSSSPQKPPQINDENAYPGASGHNRKSIRFSAVSDMDLTSASAGAFLQGAEDDSALMDEELDFDDDEMDVTQVHGNVLRKRSLSTGLARAPLSQLSSNPSGGGEPSSDDPVRYEDASHSLASEQSINSESDQSGMEFTVPLNQSLRPAQKDEAWVALVQATHSGNAQAPSSDASMEDMEVDSPVKPVSGDDSLSDASFGNDYADGYADGNETINVSKVLGRFSFGDVGRRESVFHNESAMDEDSEIYGGIAGIAATSTPRPSTVAPPSSPLPESEPEFRPYPQLSPPTTTTSLPPPSAIPTPSNIPPPTVFSRPSEKPTPSTSRPVSPKKPVFTPKSPAKATPRSFSAAFAPPVTKPLPRKSLNPPSTSTQQSIPEKRLHQDATVESSPPSPAKRQALANKWTSSVTPGPQQASSSTSTESPRPLPASKKAVFQAPSSASSSQASSSSSQAPISSIRRPSGYFARRKSLGIGLAPAEEVTLSPGATRTSPKKKAGIGLGRVSMGSGASDAWARFDRNASAPSQLNSNGKGKEKAVELPVAITITPAPEPPAAPDQHPEEQEAEMAVDEEPIATQAVDLSTLLENDGFADEDEEGQPEINVQATEQWREGVPQEGYVENDVPAISIEQFFEMTDIKFMDEIMVPRNSIHPELRRQPRAPADIPLAEYAVAMGVDVPRLVLYSRVARDLEAWLEKSKMNFREAEVEAAQMTPELFIEYSRADEDGQAELHHQLNLIRGHTRLVAKSEWSDWKLEWVKGLQVTAQESLTNLEHDAKTLSELRAKADEIEPALQAEYDEIMRELEREQQEIADIEQCDQEYLNELKASIAEQNLELDSLKNDLKENTDQLAWLQGRLEDLESQKRETLGAIDQADRYLHIQKNSTHSEVFRLKGELEALENLHMFRAYKVNPSLFEYVYAERFRVVIPCRNYVPLVDKVDITRTPEGRTKSKDDFPRLSAFLLDGAKQIVCNMAATSRAVSTRHVVQTLTDYWSSCTQVRGQLLHLSVKYPVEIEVLPQSQGFKAHADVLFPSVKGKAILSFVFSTETCARWPTTIDALQCEVKVVYGNLR
ncbi:hypothetical protein V5O48_005184 [Marasmius crinis-equi]|uniref:Spc7 kinetochore protein domain-containing protein n=1 Tax=Marasmius crinis-equi TaxID=585013 RepID=A0ABR3FN19_9AGAR